MAAEITNTFSGKRNGQHARDEHRQQPVALEPFAELSFVAWLHFFHKPAPSGARPQEERHVAS